MFKYLRLASVQIRISAASGMAYRADFIIEVNFLSGPMRVSAVV